MNISTAMSALSFRWRVLIAAISGAIAAFGLEPYGFGFAALFGIAMLPTLLWQASSWKQAAMIGWVFGTGWFAHALLWIIEPFMVDPVRHGWMAPFAIVFMAGGLALFWGAAFGLAQGVGGSRPARLLLLPLFWGLAEFARAYVLTGFPWAGIAQVWGDFPTFQLLAWVGPHGLGSLTLIAALALGATDHYRKVWVVLLAPLLTLMAVSLFLPQPDALLTDKIVRVVQPNAPQHQKWDPAHIPTFYNRQIDATAAFTDTGTRPDLIVWPESAIPMTLDNADAALEQIASAAVGSTVVLGVQRREGLRFYNALIVVGDGGQVTDLYDKHHLVPFGEYIPFGDLFAKIGVTGFASQQGQGYSSGPGAALVDLGALGTALPLICYEAVFPQDVNAAPARPDMLLQVTNDAWFGTWSGPYQHLLQARMRAVEQGLPLIRSANTGVSAVIDPYGRVLVSLPLGQSGFVDAKLPKPRKATFYSRTGDAPVFFLLLISAISISFGQSFIKRRNSR